MRCRSCTYTTFSFASHWLAFAFLWQVSNGFSETLNFYFACWEGPTPKSFETLPTLFFTHGLCPQAVASGHVFFGALDKLFGESIRILFRCVRVPGMWCAGGNITYICWIFWQGTLHFQVERLLWGCLVRPRKMMYTPGSHVHVQNVQNGKFSGESLRIQRVRAQHERPRYIPPLHKKQIRVVSEVKTSSLAVLKLNVITDYGCVWYPLTLMIESDHKRCAKREIWKVLQTQISTLSDRQFRRLIRSAALSTHFMTSSS